MNEKPMNLHCTICNQMYHQSDKEWISKEEFVRRHPDDVVSSGIYSKKCYTQYLGVYLSQAFNQDFLEELYKDYVDGLEQKIKDNEIVVECQVMEKK